MLAKRLLILLLALLPFVVPSALPYAGAESADLPVYAPVELTHPNPEPLLPLPDKKDNNRTPYAAHADGFVDDEETGAAWEYRDGTLYIKIETRELNNTMVYFTWVQIADASQLRTRVTRGETNPINEAKKIGAVLAINGDWYSARKEGIIYRNGELMRAERPFGNYDALIIDNEGNFHILYRPADNAFEPYLGSIMHSFLFGPGLVIDGELQTFDGNNYGSGPGMGLQVNAQRQAICPTFCLCAIKTLFPSRAIQAIEILSAIIFQLSGLPKRTMLRGKQNEAMPRQYRKFLYTCVLLRIYSEQHPATKLPA